MSPSEQSPICGTVVEIGLFTPDDSEWAELWPEAVERRVLQRTIADGTTMLVEFQLWAEIVQAEMVSRVGGTRSGPSSVSLERDPTVELVDAAYDGRVHLGDLYGDLGGDREIRKWDLYAAPFRLLTSAVSARLG